MDAKLFLTVFSTVFLAELGDKTQLATLLFAADRPHERAIVFAASAAALVVTSALGVLAGGLVSKVIDPRWLARAAGVGFVAIGIWTFLKA